MSDDTKRLTPEMLAYIETAARSEQQKTSHMAFIGLPSDVALLLVARIRELERAEALIDSMWNDSPLLTWPDKIKEHKLEVLAYSKEAK